MAPAELDRLVSEVTVPDSTLTPARSTTPGAATAPPPKPDITIDFAPASAADDAALVSRVAVLVNKVYFDAEGGIFHDGYQRTSAAEIGRFITDQRLVLARLAGPSSSPTTGPEDVIGCVYVKTLSPDLGDFGMLALDAAYRGGGLGRDLVLFAEAHCRRIGCTKMQLELLVPTTFEHALKTRMQAWYQRMGYRIVKLGKFQDEYPALASLLTGPADYKIFEKDLTSTKDP
ncbi:acetyltransferase (GNAT) family domain-containing protein [Purpureocillium lavendulum]|uniref:Acetyltransferase (GNAT) family domain-containing protein n=1 Tax=Purpureocillium lavendulum TaxID=1247861 RepID=A0AB34FPN9_9HYPO|nr:acetyltransferase (GNAT) family domain-containing protein [Purpureocillium lavendulum]